MKKKEQEVWNRDLQKKFNELVVYFVDGKGIQEPQEFQKCLNKFSIEDQKKILEHQHVAGFTLINAVVTWRDVNTAEYLLKLSEKVGANINIADENGKMPSDNANLYPSKEMQELLADFEKIQKSPYTNSNAVLRKVDAPQNNENIRNPDLGGYATPVQNCGGGVSMTGASKNEIIKFEKRPTADKNIYEFHPKAENQAECGNGHVKEILTEGGYVYQPIPANPIIQDGKTYIVTIPCERKANGEFSAECETLTFNRDGKLIDYKTDKPGISQLNQEEFKKQLAELQKEKDLSNKAASLQETLSGESNKEKSAESANVSTNPRRAVNQNNSLMETVTQVGSPRATSNANFSKVTLTI